jgi:hypothetical protein
MGTVPGLATGAAPSGAHCRVWPRHECELPGSCAPLTARDDSIVSWNGKLRDISLGGVGLVLSRRFEAGTVLSLELTAAAEGAPQRFLVRVVRVLPEPDHKWLLGCVLLSRLSQEKLQALLASARSKSAAKGKAGKLVVDVTFAPSARAAGVGSFRAHRLHLSAAWPPAPGTVLTLGLNGKHAGAARLRVRVRYCCRRGARWVVRYELAERPSAAVLRLLRRPGS